MSRRLATLTAACLAAVAVAAAPSGQASSAPTMVDAEQAEDCLQAYPQRASVRGLTDEGQTVVLDALVVLDGVSGGVARERLEHAKRAYAPLGIDLRIRFTTGLVRRGPDGQIVPRDSEAGRDAQNIIDWAKRMFGGRRPAGADVVYVLTDLDIHAAGVGNAVAGLADCIGGVAWDDTAFAVGELGDELDLVVASFQHEFTSKVFAHEVGHLMGAHHHYQECGAPAVGEALEGGIAPCSLMTNLVDLQGIDFSTLSGLVVRAHAVDFADR